MRRAFADVLIVDAAKPGVIDLGNRQIGLVSLRGHTRSDLALVDEDAGITFAGDLLWNGMFPNFVDATPSQLLVSITRLASRSGDAFVPGHGAMVDGVGLRRYMNLLTDLESAARTGHAAGLLTNITF